MCTVLNDNERIPGYVAWLVKEISKFKAGTTMITAAPVAKISAPKKPVV